VVLVDILEDVQQDSGLLIAPMVVVEDHIMEQQLITPLVLVVTKILLVVIMVLDML
jgi:hypothetical protein